MRVRPLSPEALVVELADRLAAHHGDGWVRVALDGAPAARPGALAEALVDPLRMRGRPAVHVSADDFLRPASLRWEAGRTNPDSFYDGWWDQAGLRREVLDPAAPGGSGRIVTSLWDASSDRASRAPYRHLPPRAVLLVSGALLLGAGLPFDVSVHLELSVAALLRRTPPDLAWTLPAYARYADEVSPAGHADVVVRFDDPRRPALVLDGV
jgi:hypothetical protein